MFCVSKPSLWARSLWVISRGTKTKFLRFFNLSWSPVPQLQFLGGLADIEGQMDQSCSFGGALIGQNHSLWREKNFEILVSPRKVVEPCHPPGFFCNFILFLNFYLQIDDPTLNEQLDHISGLLVRPNSWNNINSYPKIFPILPFLFSLPIIFLILPFYFHIP